MATDIQKMEKFNIILKSGTASTINSEENEESIQIFYGSNFAEPEKDKFIEIKPIVLL